MKIQTNKASRFNHTVTMCNEEVKFDKDGTANVPKELGDKLVTVHDTVFKFGEIDMPEVAKVNKLREKIIEEYSEEVGVTIQAFKDKIEVLSREKMAFSVENSQLKQALEGWKITVDELKAESTPREKTITRLEKELKEVTENYNILNKADPDLAKEVEEVKETKEDVETKEDKEVEDLVNKVVDETKEDEEKGEDKETLFRKMYAKGNLEVVILHAIELGFTEKEIEGKNKKELCKYIVEKSLEDDGNS